MVERYKDPDMQEIVKRSIRTAMIQENVGYGVLAELLERQGVIQTESTLRSKVSTGVMTSSLYIHILSVLNVEQLDIRALKSRYKRLKEEAL